VRLEQKPAQFVTLPLSLSLSLQIEAASENHNWDGIAAKNMGLEREREHKQGPQKAPSFEGEKGDKRKKEKKTFF
jgi:hypothetical protein